MPTYVVSRGVLAVRPHSNRDEALVPDSRVTDRRAQRVAGTAAFDSKGVGAFTPKRIQLLRNEVHAAQARDASLSRDVMRALATNERTRNATIDVDVLNAVVSLRGVVPTAGVRQAGVSIAAQVPGVRRVRDRLRANSTAVDIDLSDILAVAEVGRALSFDRRLRRTDIDVRVEAGVVTLSGFVEGEGGVIAAERIAASVVGARNVRNQLAAVRLVEHARATMRSGGRPRR